MAGKGRSRLARVVVDRNAALVRKPATLSSPPVTEDIDRREKFLNYRRIASVEEYVLIAQRSPQVIVFRRGDNWNPTVLTSLDDVVESRSVELSVSLEEIYAGIR